MSNRGMKKAVCMGCSCCNCIVFLAESLAPLHVPSWWAASMFDGVRYSQRVNCTILLSDVHYLTLLSDYSRV